MQTTVTSASELEQALGIPSVTIPRADGKVMWIYEGIHKTPGATQFIPYVNWFIGRNDKDCTRLTVLVDKDTGALSDWNYSEAKDSEHWARANDKCRSGAAGKPPAKAAEATAPTPAPSAAPAPTPAPSPTPAPAH